MTARSGTKGLGLMSQAVRSIWLTVARCGWCDVDEVRAECNADESVSVVRRLHDLKSAGYIRARTIPRVRRKRLEGSGSVPVLEYAVTPDCRLPAGLTVQEVASALAVGRWVQ